MRNRSGRSTSLRGPGEVVHEDATADARRVTRPGHRERHELPFRQDESMASKSDRVVIDPGGRGTPPRSRGRSARWDELRLHAWMSHPAPSAWECTSSSHDNRAPGNPLRRRRSVGTTGPPFNAFLTSRPSPSPPPTPSRIASGPAACRGIPAGLAVGAAESTPGCRARPRHSPGPIRRGTAPRPLRRGPATSRGRSRTV